MGCDFKWEESGKYQTCKFDSEKQLFKCDKLNYCRFHLPLLNEIGKETEKENWVDGKGLEEFNNAIYDHIRNAKNQNKWAFLIGVVFPGEINFSTISDDTSDLIKRVYEHKSDAVKEFTEQHGVHTLVWYEQHENMESAISREKNMKEWKRVWKLELIEEMNPDWEDLYPGLL